MLRGILITLAVLAAIVVIVVAVGYALPVAHVASVQRILPAPPEKIFAVLTEVEAFPQWRQGVTSVEVLSSVPPRRWIEKGDDEITFEVVEQSPPSRLVSRIADPNLPFGGTWTYELAPEGSGTRLTITERGEVYNPFFRFMSRFVFGHTATMEQFLDDLAKRGHST